jgi:hypothetical protein
VLHQLLLLLPLLPAVLLGFVTSTAHGKAAQTKR